MVAAVPDSIKCEWPLLAEPGPSPMSAFYSTFSPRTNTNW